MMIEKATTRSSFFRYSGTISVSKPTGNALASSALFSLELFLPPQKGQGPEQICKLKFTSEYGSSVEHSVLLLLRQTD